ncbi:MAG: hypothetical protein QOG69_2800 [Actinomycetota bacterium]|nr:hypothetical protein [Actinomycetota bacterium]
MLAVLMMFPWPRAVITRAACFIPAGVPRT